MPENRLSRRTFLGMGAAAAGALTTTSVLLHEEPLWASPRPVAPSDRVRFGMVGVGMQGSGLLGHAIELSGVECAAACDLYDGRHTLAREITASVTGGTPLRTTRRYEELLADKNIDCIVAAVPDHWHKQIVVDAVSAGKDIYCEKPMSHTPADGLAMMAAAKKTGRIVQIGSQRVSSVICGKARELIAQGAIGDLMMVEGALGRNSPSGAWEYPPPPDLSPQNLDWDRWQGTVPKRAFDPLIFARWRCWKEYGTGVAGDLLVHLMSGMLYVLSYNEAPKRAMAMGGILRWKDGRNMPDVQATLFEYEKAPVYMRLNLGTETPEVYKFMGSKGMLELTSDTITYTPQTGDDDSPSYYVSSYPHQMREQYIQHWHEEHDPPIGQGQEEKTTIYRSDNSGDVRPHLWNFFQAVRSRKPVVEDAVFGHHAALACHMANESYFRKGPVTWDESAGEIRSA